MAGSFMIFFLSALLPLTAAAPNHGHSHAHAHRDFHNSVQRDQGHAHGHSRRNVHDARAVPNLGTLQSQDPGCGRRPGGVGKGNGSAMATGPSSNGGGIFVVPSNVGNTDIISTSTSEVNTATSVESSIASSTGSVETVESKDPVAVLAAVAPTSSLLEAFQTSHTLVTSYSAATVVTSRSAAETPTAAIGSDSGSDSGSAPLPTGNADYLTVRLRNMMSSHLTTSHQMNDGPADVMAMKATLTDGTMSPGATATMIYPSGWAGMMAVAKAATSDEEVVDLANGSLLEGSFVNQMGEAAVGDIDISYVSGYSVPITCTCENSQAATVTFGCSTDLFQESDPCPDTCFDGSTSCLVGSTCHNPLRPLDVDDLEAVPFFKPCQGTAFTFARDTANSQNSQCTTNVVSCCIGTAEDGCPNWNAQIANDAQSA